MAALTAIKLNNFNSNYKLSNSAVSGSSVVRSSKFHQTSDIFVRSKAVSFGNFYNKHDAERFIDDIVNGKITTNKRGYQGEFFKFGEQFGIKSINPMDKTSYGADLTGINNAREYYILNVIKDINPEIATKPVDLINKQNKYFLVTEFLNGRHPFDSSLNDKQLQDILKKTVDLDKNGIFHCDLQSGNIFLLNNEKAKFIDFGAYELLKNDGSYLSSAFIPVQQAVNNEIKSVHNSSLEGKFLATFYNNIPKEHLIAYSDNPYLKMKSNVSNLEYRLIYDYLAHDKAEHPKEFFVNYLKNKSENYHKPMAEFLQKLEISPLDVKQLNQRNAAVNVEKLFSDVFSNPSENIVKSELEKIQLKWLMNDYQGGKNKAFDYFNKYLANIEQYSLSSNNAEKQYFEEMKRTLASYRPTLDNDLYKGKVLSDEENLLIKIFKKTQAAILPKKEELVAAVEKTAEEAKEQINNINPKNNKLGMLVLAVAAVCTAIILWVKNRGQKA